MAVKNFAYNINLKIVKVLLRWLNFVRRLGKGHGQRQHRILNNNNNKPGEPIQTFLFVANFLYFKS